MNKSGLAVYSLFPPILLWGVLLGGIAYSHTVFLPVYLSDLPNSAAVVNGKYALNEAPFWTSLHPLLILSLLIALASNWKYAARRNLIAASFALYISVLITTAVYFLPELLSFAKSPESNLPAPEWFARGHRWQTLSLIRGAVCVIGILPLLVANTKIISGREGNEKLH